MISSSQTPISRGMSADRLIAGSSNGFDIMVSPSTTGRKSSTPSLRATARVRAARISSCVGLASASGVGSSIPSSSSSRRVIRVARSGVAILSRVDALWITARWNRPRAAGIAIRPAILPPPPDWPNSVTFDGSPPNAAALSRIHSSAQMMSVSDRFAPSWPGMMSPK